VALHAEEGQPIHPVLNVEAEVHPRFLLLLENECPLARCRVARVLYHRLGRRHEVDGRRPDDDFHYFLNSKADKKRERERERVIQWMESNTGRGRRVLRMNGIEECDAGRLALQKCLSKVGEGAICCCSILIIRGLPPPTIWRGSRGARVYWKGHPIPYHAYNRQEQQRQVSIQIP
jgi:hypothetical protein